MGSRGQSASKGRRRAEARAARGKAINEPEKKPQETREERLARVKAFQESHVNFMGEWVDKPQTLSGYGEMGKLHDVLGVTAAGNTTKSAEELKEIIGQMNDLKVDVSRMKNPNKMVEKILDAAGRHNLEKAKSDKDWAINILGKTSSEFSYGTYTDREMPAFNGQDRAEFLGLNPKLYADRAAAKQWHREWTKILHPDNNPNNPLARNAMAQVQRIYERMVR